MTDYDKLEEQRQMTRSNYYAQMAMMGYDSGGNPLDDIVRVVRCRNCKWWEEGQTTDGVKGFCPISGCCEGPEFYCADGKRREIE